MKRAVIYLLILLITYLNAQDVQQYQDQDDSILTLERIYGLKEFDTKRFRGVKWIDNGSGYTMLENSSEDKMDGKDIVRYDSQTGEKEIILPATKLIPQGEKYPLKIDKYEWSLGQQKILIFTNTKKVWRQNTRGDYWILDLSNWKLHKLGGDFKPSSLMFASFSPDGKKVCYVHENNLYVENLIDNQIIQLTKDGSRTIINGTFDWVYEEEFGLRNGFRWSPDSKFIAYWQLDAKGVRDFYLINNTDSLYSRVIPVQYPKAGETNSSCRVGVIESNGGETTWINVSGDPRNHYIASMEWADNSDEIVIQRLNRLQNTIWIIMADARTGHYKTVLIEKDDAWVDMRNNSLEWLDEGNKFTWVSERDGWRHVYLVSRSGEEITLITPSEFDAIRVIRVDEDKGWLYFIASPDNPAQRYLYRVALNGEGNVEKVTPLDLNGNNSYDISPDSKWAFHTFSSFDNPPITQLIKLPDHKIIRTLLDHPKVRLRVKSLERSPTEFFRIDTENGIQLDGWCMKPHDLDPNKKYPVLFHVYGEPAGQTVMDRWSRNYPWHLMLTQQGYIIMSVDNRGTPAPRGRAWRKSIYRKIGIIASEDQAAALRAITKKWSYVDANRIGIWGWSGGGSMSLNMIFRYPELYHTAMSIAPVGNQRNYDTIYQERYMGLPKDNVEGYKNGSPLTFAHQLEGNLLIIHGTGDDNVHYQNTEVVINALIEANKKFTMMAYPNRSHSIKEGKNTTRHLFELLTSYLQDNLSAGPR